VGKIGIPERLLHKSEALQPEELQQMRAHPIIGAEILRGIAFLEAAAPAVRSHHERWDGAGYPDRLAGEAIPVVARIVNAVDTFDACTTDRPYQPMLPTAAAVAVLVGLRGTQIDPDVCDALVRVLRRRATASPPDAGLAAGA
jgi:HD-GYP domain-containing protein (c-di-GMP phosphodiesterase class II)